MGLRRSKVNIWHNLICPHCGNGYTYENGVSAPDPALAATFTTRRFCSYRCAVEWSDQQKGDSK